MTPETAPAECSPFAAGNRTAEGGLHSPPAVPASDPVPVAGGDRADVAHDAEDKGLAIWCSCGQWSMLHFNSFGLDAYEAHAQHVAKARTLAAAEATVALALNPARPRSPR